MSKGRRERVTITGGRDATQRHIPGDAVLAICRPTNLPTPTGWAWHSLNELAQMESGHTPSRNHSEYWGGEIPWMAVGDAGRNHGAVIYDTKEHVTQLGIKNSSARLLPKGTVCLSRGGTVGYVTVLSRTMSTSQGFANWICGELLNPFFLMYLFLREHSALDRFAIGATIKTIYYPDIKALHVCVPPLSEQHRIVEILDKAFADIAKAKANAEQNLRNARELFESQLNEVFTKKGEGWEEKRLEDICAITSKLVDPRTNEYLDLAHVGAANIESKTGAFIDVKSAREEGLISGKFLFDDSMVLYSKIRPYLMKVARPDFIGLCSADMYPLLPRKNHIARDYLYHMLLSKHFTDYVIQGSARAGMPKVNRKHLFDYRVWLPDVTRQEITAANLDALSAETRRQAGIYQRKLDELEALKKSILHTAFSGEL